MLPPMTVTVYITDVIGYIVFKEKTGDSAGIVALEVGLLRPFIGWRLAVDLIGLHQGPVGFHQCRIVGAVNQHVVDFVARFRADAEQVKLAKGFGSFRSAWF